MKNRTNRLLVSLAGASALTAAASAQTVTVTTLNDTSDFVGAKQVADLPGADGIVSFREAVDAANNTPGPQRIEFAIPTSEFWLVDDYALLRLEDGVFVVTDDETYIDFGSQADNIGDTNPNGREVGVYGLQANGWGQPAILIRADNCVIEGMGQVHLRGSAVTVWDGSGNRIIGCNTSSIELEHLIGLDPASFNIVGGTEPGEGNILGGVQIICGAHDNDVIGNTVDHVSVGGSEYCDFPRDNRIGGPTEAERNIINGFGNFSSEGRPLGSGVLLVEAVGTLVENNYIGVTPDGMNRVFQRGPVGIDVRDSFDSVIRNNLVSGIRAVGVNHFSGDVFGNAIVVSVVNGASDNTVIQGNIIGADATGENPITTRQGIHVVGRSISASPTNVLIGGPNPGDANIIAFTELTGVQVATESQVEISMNSIHSNEGVGIELLGAANGSPSVPVLDLVEASPSDMRVVGSLSGVANETYRIEFFLNLTCDQSGSGEGRTFVGSMDITMDGTGMASFDDSFASVSAEGNTVTATATRLSTNSTSEFSVCLNAVEVSGECAGDCDGSGVVDFNDLVSMLFGFSDPDPGVGCDVDGSGSVDFNDLAGALFLFGPCE